VARIKTTEDHITTKESSADIIGAIQTTNDGFILVGQLDSFTAYSGDKNSKQPQFKTIYLNTKHIVKVYV